MIDYKEKWQELRKQYGKERIIDIRFDNKQPCSFENVEYNMIGFADYTFKNIFTFQISRYHWFDGYHYFLRYTEYKRKSNGVYEKQLWNGFEVSEAEYKKYLLTVSEIPSNKHIQINF